MCNRRLARRLLCLILLFFLMPGCQVIQGERTLTVLVRDAETKQPIPSAEVYLCQCLKDNEIAPCRSRNLTHENGIAQVRAEANGQFGLQVQAIAPGHLVDQVTVPAEVLNGRRQPSGKRDKPAGASGSPDVIVEVYSEPSFRVEFVLPSGYRGLVKAEIQLQDNVPLAPHQRCFRFDVSRTGEVLLTGPSLLQRVAATEYRARYDNGPLLGERMDAEKVGFRWIKGAGKLQYFVVGTQVDYEVLHRRLAPEETQAANGSWDDSSGAGRSHKFRYGKLTGKD
jgi:hypothetical protein